MKIDTSLSVLFRCHAQLQLLCNSHSEKAAMARNLCSLSLYRSRPTQPKINFMWEICTYCSSICTLGLLLNFKLSFPKPKSKIIHKIFFLLEAFFAWWSASSNNQFSVHVFLRHVLGLTFNSAFPTVSEEWKTFQFCYY